MRYAAFSVGSSNMDGNIGLMGMIEVFIQCNCISKSFFIARGALSFKHGHLVKKIFACFCVIHTFCVDIIMR